MRRINVSIPDAQANEMDALRGITGKTNEQLITEAWKAFMRQADQVDEELENLIPVFLKHRKRGADEVS